MTGDHGQCADLPAEAEADMHARRVARIVDAYHDSLRTGHAAKCAGLTQKRGSFSLRRGTVLAPVVDSGSGLVYEHGFRPRTRESHAKVNDKSGLDGRAALGGVGGLCRAALRVAIDDLARYRRN
ncbi:hypothetical protein [Micromonospora sp. NPDC005173]|uniref:hypothetical protein n=1 Tax=Micromonospora sp. NPDC005173 TaxID=3157165 RepID=UPI0033A191AC